MKEEKLQEVVCRLPNMQVRFCESRKDVYDVTRATDDIDDT